jgi:hypothetical protein
MSASAVLAPDAAMALGIASTAMPFARTAEAQAERWLRILRLHGQAGAALQALGVGEERLHVPGEDAGPEGAATDWAEQRDPVEWVTEAALRIASERGAGGITTIDLLLAVMRVYGEDFDRALQARGTDRDELTERLGVEPPER